MKNKITIIVLTGGPCSGKTTVLTYLRQKLEERGNIVIVVPEAATLCINGGLSPISTIIGMDNAQIAITTLAYHLENVWRKAAEHVSEKGNVVVLCDRGIVDSSAYTSKHLYEGILAHNGLNPVQVRDSRYNGVIHMVTAANGAREFYSLANNAARYETPEMACVQDEKIIAAWTGHEHLRIIGNSTDFEGKIRRVYNEVCGILGTPPIECEWKFLVSFERKRLPDYTQRIDIEQFYPISNDPHVTLRLRKRGQHGFYTYYRTTKQPCGHGKNIEIQDFTTAERYESSREFMRPDTAVVEKTRSCFVSHGQYFELDEFKDKRAIPSQGLLEIEITDPDKKIEFPEWIKVDAEVTGDPRFSNFGIAQVLARKG